MINNLKAVIADIDGTLVTKGEGMMPLTHDAIEILHKHGVLFGLASGRPVTSSMYNRKNQWNLSFDFDVMIGINGAQLKDCFHEEMEEYYKLPKETMREILDLMRPFDCAVQVYDGEQMYATKIDASILASMKRNNVEMIVKTEDEICSKENFNLIFRFDPAMTDEIVSYVEARPSEKYIGVMTSSGIMEFMDPRINKGLAVEMFAKRNNIPLDEIMCFGDMQNDLGMMKSGAWSVCLKNGCKECKEAADAVTEHDCNDDGVGHYLFDHVIVPSGWDKD